MLRKPRVAGLKKLRKISASLRFKSTTCGILTSSIFKFRSKRARVRYPARNVPAGNTFHRRNAHNFRCSLSDHFVERVCVLVHLLDVLKQGLRFRTNHHAFPIAIEQFDGKQRFKPAYPAAYRRVVEPKLARCSMDAALAGHLEENPEVIPFGGRGAPTKRLFGTDIHSESLHQTITRWCKNTQ